MSNDRSSEEFDDHVREFHVDGSFQESQNLYVSTNEGENRESASSLPEGVDRVCKQSSLAGFSQHKKLRSY